MMKIVSPKLFYWFRRASGLFFLFAFSCYYGQMTLVGDVVIVSSNDNSTVYISPETYVHNSEIGKRNKGSKTVNIVTKTFKKKKNTDQKLAAPKGRKSTPACQYDYTPGQAKDIFISATVTKTAFTNSNHHNTKKHLTPLIKWDSANIFPLAISKTFTKEIGKEFESPHHSFKVRPPPISSAI